MSSEGGGYAVGADGVFLFCPSFFLRTRTWIVAFAVILLGNNKDFHPTTYLKRKTFPTLTPSSH
jgi:hypothetical protein